MKKLTVIVSITFLVKFLGLFIYFYKTSGKFRKSIIAAFVVVSFYFSGLKPAHSNGQSDAFTIQNQKHRSPPKKEGFFSRTSNNDGSGPGKPDGDDDGGIPSYPRLERVEETETRLEWMQNKVKKLKEETDSESESELTQNAGSYDYIDIMKKLKKQQRKRKFDIQVGDQIYTIKNYDNKSAVELQYELAEKIYDSIRESDTDISDIASNVEFKADNIKKVKDHIFYNEHDLDRYKDSETKHRRFEADLRQALAWKRLETGTHDQNEITWIKHEYAERHHELKYGSGYSEAHNRAESRYKGEPWPKKNFDGYEL